MFLILIFGLFLSPLITAESNEKPVLQEITIPNLKENQTLHILCALSHGESVSFEWFMNNQKMKEDDRRKTKFNEDSSELIIKNLSVDDIGEIKCVGTNKYGQDTQKIKIFMNVKPKWTKEPKDITDVLSKEIVLECDAKGFPIPNIKWYKLAEDRQNVIKEFKSKKINFELTKNVAECIVA